MSVQLAMLVATAVLAVVAVAAAVVAVVALRRAKALGDRVPASASETVYRDHAETGGGRYRGDSHRVYRGSLPLDHRVENATGVRQGAT